MKTIPLSRVYDSDEIRRRVVEVIDSGQFILGPECKLFEKELAEYLGTSRFVLSNSWTSAVHLLFLALDFPRGSEVLLPSLTAFPSVEPICHAGLNPVFVEVDDTYCLDPDDLERKVTSRSVGILPVHLYGQPADLARVRECADRHGLVVIEDCAQAIGARCEGRRVGSFGKAAGFSFYPSKNLTVCGDGGGIATDDDGLAERVASLRDHGRSSKYLNDRLGFNMRFNEIQAAVGRCQLKVLEDLNRRRREIARLYGELLQGTVVTPTERPGVEHVYHLYVVRADRRDELQLHLRSHGIQTGIHYPIPVHRQPAITDRFGESRLPFTDQLTGQILSLPMYPGLSDDEVDFVAQKVRSFYRG